MSSNQEADREAYTPARLLGVEPMLEQSQLSRRQPEAAVIMKGKRWGDSVSDVGRLNELDQPLCLIAMKYSPFVEYRAFLCRKTSLKD